MTDGPPFPYAWDTPAEIQQLDWTCSGVSTRWCLKSLGYAVDPETQITAMVQQGYISPELGCLDASGAGLCDFVRLNYGLSARNTYYASWEDVVVAAGRWPCMLGGAQWYHWSALRAVDGDGNLALANPAPSWQGVGQTMTPAEFATWGPWALVEVAYDLASSEEDPVAIAELEAEVARLQTHNADLINAIGYLQGTVADAIQSSHDDMVLYASTGPDEAFLAAAGAQTAAINTLVNTGKE